MNFPRLTRRQQKQWEVLQFLIRFLTLAVPLYLILWLNPSLLPVQEAVTDHSHILLKAMGLEVDKSNLMLMIGTCRPFVIYIGPDCTGWKSMVAYFALIFATLGASMRKRVLGLLIGIPLIYAGNLARIVTAIVIEQTLGREAVMFFHDFMWQVGLTALIIVLWLAWLKWDFIKKHIIALREKLKYAH
ncbi:MAG: exosortase/archaeosortase family protein [Candidatus Aenigmatarchaeota archaeon]|nr:MAG: exosortase/archaeosortase family protein [Candidatus Aenigmarchaeota archaeon]